MLNIVKIKYLKHNTKVPLFMVILVLSLQLYLEVLVIMNPGVGKRFSLVHNHPDCPWSQPILLYNGHTVGRA